MQAASSSNINNMNYDNNSNPSIEEIDAQLAANTASIDDILDEETHMDSSGDVDAADMEEMPPLSQAGAVPEVLAEAQAFTPQDEQRELDSLTLEERMAIQSDLLGITMGVSNLAVAVRASSAATGNVSDMGGIAAGILEHASFGGPNDHMPSTSKSFQDDGWATTLHRLEQEIAALPTSQTGAYRRAQRECPDEVSDRRKMAFVEYDNGSVKEAAVRLCKYWEERLSAFGPDRAFLPMTLAGAMKDEVVPMINYPIWRRLPLTDAAGRAILYGETSLRDFTKYSPEQEVRAMMYMMETILEDDDVRRKGYVALYNSQNLQQHQASRALTRQLAAFLEAVYPIRTRAAHMCHPTKFMYYMFLPVVKIFMPKELRVRIKIHYGDTEKVLRELDGFCLPRDRVPDSLGGGLHYNMNQWVLDRMAVENRRLMLQIQSAGFGTAISNMRQISVTSDMTTNSNGDTSTNSSKGLVSKKRRGSASKKATRSKSSSSDSKNVKKRKGEKHQTKPTSTKKQQQDLIRGPPRGKYVDPRMQKAVEAKMNDPKLPLYDALVIGGFVFSDDPSAKDEMVDLDGTTLAQRKNNLCRRIRIEKEKLAKKSG